MKHTIYSVIFIMLFSCGENKPTSRMTEVTFDNEKIFINGVPGLQGIQWNGIDMEGLLPNARLVQGIFDDLNPETVDLWKYPDTGEWDPDRNTREFVAAMPDWRAHGLLGFTICLQGGSPQGYSSFQPWHNSAIDSLGNLRQDYMNRLEKIMDKSDELGMVTILGIFYFGQDERLTGDEAAKNAVRNTIDWLIEKGYRNVLIEIANECNNNAYSISVIKEDRAHELIELAQNYSDEKGYRYPVSTSFNGNTLPPSKTVEVADFILLHGNGVNNPSRITEMVELVRAMPEYKPMPIIFNEDDHFDFDKEQNNMLAAFRAGASWGYFDYRMKDEGFEAGYQSVPVDWKIGHERKIAFFGKLKEILSE
ncbi:MAG: hypothetical protein IH594_13140 [Bacteroidales bacterium]|nr:hypothetical protein [Bacteroidales bacterium]